ncbi:interferon lambda receptor 1-like [Scomber japonicus]|uniref:interferon lambda receptor 1-like n=1 Tax=Scomber japonicus TaxID=13676 RepID=UPI002304E395|nr:interferon lambda receptor 1-like [Scomber japonicus]
MNSSLLALSLMFLIDSVFGSLPAPVNVSMSSTDFHHFLRWDPGPGTPPGTLYKIFNSLRKTRHNITETTETSLWLQLDKTRTYRLTVQAYYNQTQHSPPSSELIFIPGEHTKLSAPKLSLAGCGDCIHINISLKEEVQEFYNPRFTLLWWKRNEPKGNHEISTTDKPSFTLDNLEKGEEYCVQVETEAMTNHFPKSAVSCTFTSVVDTNRVYVILGAVAGTVIFVIGAFTSVVLCLQYTGFLCKLKATLPRALTAVRNSTLLSGKILTLEQTIPDLISVRSETDTQDKSRNPTVPLPVPKSTSTGNEVEEEEDDEEEEDGAQNPYMDRDGGLSSGENSHQDSRDVTANGALAAQESTLLSGKILTLEQTIPDLISVRSETEDGTQNPYMDRDSGLSSGENSHQDSRDVTAEVEEADTELNPYEGKDRGEVSVVSERRQTGVQGYGTGQEEEEEEQIKEEACHSSGNINLFSVTLTALADVERSSSSWKTGGLIPGSSSPHVHMSTLNPRFVPLLRPQCVNEKEWFNSPDEQVGTLPGSPAISV